MITLWQDIRYGIRMLLRKPGFTFIVVLVLALGIGPNTAIFSVVNGVILRPLPFEDPDHLVMVWGTIPEKGWYQMPTSFPNFLDLRDQNQVLGGIAAYQLGGFALTVKSESQQVQGGRVSDDFFQVLGVQPSLGRVFSDEEQDPDVVVISHDLWQHQFGSDPHVIGKTMTLNTRPHIVIGVTPPDFWFPIFWNSVKGDQLWVPLRLKPDEQSRGNKCLVLIGRLKSGITLRQAQAGMNTVATRLGQEYPGTNTGVTVNLVPAYKQLVGDIQTALLVLFGAAGFVLIIVCANIATLLMARAESRQKELAIRSAIGASRLRLLCQLLTESILLSAIGGILGIVLAVISVDPMLALKPGSIPRLDEISIDGSVLGFTVTISVLTCLLFGLTPALQISGINLNKFLKEGSRTSTEGVQRHHLRRALVVSEVALSLMLLIGAGLMMKSFLRLQNVNPGFNPQNLLLTRISLPRDKWQQLIERTEALPYVRSVGAVNRLPVNTGSQTLDFTIEEHPTPEFGQKPVANCHVASPDYFRTMGIPILMGRPFAEKDIGEAPPVAIINQALASRYLPGEEPVGKHLNIDGKSCEIVGVIGDVKHGGLTGQVEPEIYWPYLQQSGRTMWVVVRSARDPVGLARPLWDEAKNLGGKATSMATMEHLLARAFSGPRFNTLLLTIFASAAAILAGLGVYGIMSYTVIQRAHEIGVRKALGAEVNKVLRMVMWQGFKLILVGVIGGLSAALALTRIISSLLYNVSPTDPVTFICVSLFLIGMALLACYIPAHRAAKIEPMEALRYE